ncbi:MAG: response regulator [Gammaproteobacteria bacterium]
MNKKVLVIDDDEAIRKAFCLALEDLCCEVEVAESGEIGIQKFKENSDISLIFLDLRMPGMSGLETLLAIRHVNKKVPIYVITAFYKEFFAGLQETAKNGISFDLLNKPISSEDILNVTKGIIEQK